jgi:hypothetical protein
MNISRLRVPSYLFLGFFLLVNHSMIFASVTLIDTRSRFEKLISQHPYLSPSSSLSTPVAYGLGWGTFFLGLAGQLGTASTTRPFGQYGLGFGLGNPNRYLGLTTILTSGGLDEFKRDGNLNFQLSHNFLGTGSAIAVGAQNVSSWGADANNKISSYIVGSQLFTFRGKNSYFANVIATVGGGNTRFVHDLSPTKRDAQAFRPFGSIGVQVLPQASIIAEYVGSGLNAGFSIIPFTKLPLVATIMGLNLNNRGQHIPIAGAVSYVILF